MGVAEEHCDVQRRPLPDAIRGALEGDAGGRPNDQRRGYFGQHRAVGAADAAVAQASVRHEAEADGTVSLGVRVTR